MTKDLGFVKIRAIVYVVVSLFLFAGAEARAGDDPDQLFRQGKYAEAEKAYARSDMDNPKDIRFRYNRGCAAFQNSDLKTAVASFSSVLRRTDARDIRFKASYNLGNAAFKQGDFESASSFYRQALKLNPESEDSRHNLELALRELAKQKEKEKEKQQEKQQPDSADKGKKGEQSKAGDKGKTPEKGSEGQKDSGKGEDRGPAEKNGSDAEGEKQESEKDHPANLQGSPGSQQDTGKGENQEDHTRAGAAIDRKRAEAMLDNLQEDRSRFFRFQIPEDKRHGVGSGKDW